MGLAVVKTIGAYAGMSDSSSHHHWTSASVKGWMTMIRKKTDKWLLLWRSGKYSIICLLILSAMVWMFQPSSNSYVEILMPNVMVFRGGAFKRWYVMRMEPLGTGLCFYKRDLAPSTIWGQRKQSASSLQPERGACQSLAMLAPWSQTFSLQNHEK